MPHAIFTFTLKTGISAADYRRWVAEFDRPRVAQIPSVCSQTILLCQGGPVFGKESPDFDALEIIEYTNLEDYRNDLQTHPAAIEIARALPHYVDMSSLQSTLGSSISGNASGVAEIAELMRTVVRMLGEVNTKL